MQRDLFIVQYNIDLFVRSALVVNLFMENIICRRKSNKAVLCTVLCGRAWDAFVLLAETGRELDNLDVWITRDALILEEEARIAYDMMMIRRNLVREVCVGLHPPLQANFGCKVQEAGAQVLFIWNEHRAEAVELFELVTHFGKVRTFGSWTTGYRVRTLVLPGFQTSG